MIWLFQTDIQFQESKDKRNARKGKYNTCIISMMLPILCWYARRCRQFRVWNISYKFPTSWIKKKTTTFYFWHHLNWKTTTIQEQDELSPSICSIEQNGYLSQCLTMRQAAQRRGPPPFAAPKSHSPCSEDLEQDHAQLMLFQSLPWKDMLQTLSNRGLLCPSLP